MNDDIDYVFSANEVSEGRFYPLYGESINAIRSMMTVPVAFFFEIFGTSIFSASIYPVICSLLTIIFVFYIGKTLVNYKIGLISSFILSIYPLDVAYSTQLVPTTPVTMFMTLALLFFIFAEKSKKKRKLFYILSGLMIGLSYLANIITPILFLSFAISYFVFNRKIKKEYLYIILGGLLVFSCEITFMYVNTGNPLHRLDVIHETEKMIGTNTAMDYYPRIMLKVKNVNFQAHEGNLGIYFYLFSFACAFALLFKPRKSLWFLILSFILIMGYLEFGVMTSGFKPIAKWVRYLIVFGPIFSLLIGNMFGEVIKKDLLKIVLIILLFVVTIPYISGSVEAYRSWTHEFVVEYEYLKNLPEKIIYTDIGSGNFLRFYFGYNRDIRNMEGVSLDEISDSYVLVNGSRGAVYYESMRERLPDFTKNPPESWKLLTSLNPGIVTPKIYYVS